PTDKLGLDSSEFLWLFHTNQLVSKVERILERFFSKQHGVANESRLLIDATNGAAGYRQETIKSGLALVEILLRYCTHPVAYLQSLFSILCRAKSVVPLAIAIASLKSGRVFRLEAGSVLTEWRIRAAPTSMLDN